MDERNNEAQQDQADFERDEQERKWQQWFDDVNRKYHELERKQDDINDKLADYQVRIATLDAGSEKRAKYEKFIGIF
jgi:uncharacterized protein YlxW (UPF0749 family)